MTILGAGEPPVVVVVDQRPLVIEPKGPTVNIGTGKPGPQGPPGPPGSPASTFDYFMPVPADTWIINHNLGRKVDVALYTTGSVKMSAEVILISDNQAVASFSTPTAGFARVI